ncbi:MAG: hypothetical protein ACOCWM_04950 [Cyclobacteriaceae bacterium]
MKNLFLCTTIFMIALNMFLLLNYRKQRADFEAITSKLSRSLPSENIAWEFVENAIQFNDSELFNPEIKQFLDIKKDITPLLIINGKQCQPCIDLLMKNFLTFEDSLEIIPEIRFVFITDSTENSNNVNFLGKYLQKHI